MSIGLLVLIGFGVGAIIGAGTSVAGQYIANGYSWDNFSWGQLALDTILGGASGMLSMSPLGRLAMIAANAGIAFVGAVGGHLINGSDFDASTWLDIGISTMLGVAAGALGGRGALNVKGLNEARKTAGFIRASGLYDKVMTKAVTGGYRTAGIAANALRLSRYNLTRQWNKMIVKQAGDALAKSLAISAGVLFSGSAVKPLIVNQSVSFFNL